jgi:hypothetical protein
MDRLIAGIAGCGFLDRAFQCCCSQDGNYSCFLLDLQASFDCESRNIVELYMMKCVDSSP